MRTRTLLLLAVGCGLVILAAGVVQLLRIAGQDDPPTAAPVGAPVAVADMTVTVLDTTEGDGMVPWTSRSVASTIPTAPTSSGSSSPATSLRARPRRLAAAATTVDVQRCTLTFDLGGTEGSSRVLLYRRGDERVRWELAERGD